MRQPDDPGIDPADPPQPTLGYRIAWAVIAALFLLCLWMSFTTRVLAEPGAHGHLHAQNHPWYKTLKRPDTGVSCCGNYDCGVTTARFVNGRWEALFEGRWMPIPPTKVLNVRSPDGEAHICAAKKAQEPYCFVPPDLTG